VRVYFVFVIRRNEMVIVFEYCVFVGRGNEIKCCVLCFYG
jgi:hypothetical protein